MSVDPLTLINADCLTALRGLPADSVQCCVTSPPYWGLRDYGVAGQIGLEPTLAEWLAKIVEVFREVRRVLRPDGTCWVNMGDAYNAGTSSKRNAPKAGTVDVGGWQDAEIDGGARVNARGLKPKDLIGQPWRLAFALQADGWWLRRDIVWHKPNPMPETVYDRPTTAHEYVFLLTKAGRYFYNAEAAREPVTGGSHARGDGVNRKIKTPDGWDTAKGTHGTIHREGREKGKTRPRQNESFSSAVNGLVDDRNWRSVWTIPTEAYAGSHFATFPEALAGRCIIAGSRAGDVVLDPFGGSGTTGAVAIGMGRRAVLVELNPAYCALIRQRCETTIGLPLSA